MNGQFPETVLSNLQESIRFSIEFSRLLIKQKKADLAAEILTQVIRDIYLYQKREFLQDRASAGLKDLGISLNDEESVLIEAIEKSMRKEKDYLELTKTIDLTIIDKLLEKIEKSL